MYLGHDIYLKLTIIMSLNLLIIVHCSLVLYSKLIYQMSFTIGQWTLLKQLDKLANFFHLTTGVDLGPLCSTVESPSHCTNQSLLHNCLSF